MYVIVRYAYDDGKRQRTITDPIGFILYHDGNTYRGVSMHTYYKLYFANYWSKILFAELTGRNRTPLLMGECLLEDFIYTDIIAALYMSTPPVYVPV